MVIRDSDLHDLSCNNKCHMTPSLIAPPTDCKSFDIMKPILLAALNKMFTNIALRFVCIFLLLPESFYRSWHFLAACDLSCLAQARK